jgi:hypothetical protein
VFAPSELQCEGDGLLKVVATGGRERFDIGHHATIALAFEQNKNALASGQCTKPSVTLQRA